MTDAPPSGPEPPAEPPVADDEAPAAPPGRRRIMAAHPLVAGAVFVALVASAARALHPGHFGTAATAPPAPLPSYEVPCPSGSVPDFPRSPAAVPSGEGARAVCIPVPLHREDVGRVALSDALERRADRPEDFTRYALPFPSTQITPDALGENAPSTADAVRLVAEAGSLARALKLEGQNEPTRVVFAGQRDGWTVITAHTVPRERGPVTFLLVYSGLESLSAGLAAATPEKPVLVEVDAPLGQSGALLFGVRQLRQGVSLGEAVPKLGADAAIATDARNMLPLAPVR